MVNAKATTYSTTTNACLPALPGPTTMDKPASHVTLVMLGMDRNVYIDVISNKYGIIIFSNVFAPTINFGMETIVSPVIVHRYGMESIKNVSVGLVATGMDLSVSPAPTGRSGILKPTAAPVPRAQHGQDPAA